MAHMSSILFGDVLKDLGYIGFILGVIGIMEKKMETTDYLGFRVRI